MKKRHNKLSYPKIIALGYGLIIILGTLLLMLPFASRAGLSTSFADAFFTSASASCLTGMVVLDTYQHWSLFGQLVILLLIQIGGIGFLTIAASFSAMLRRKISLKEKTLLRDNLNAMSLSNVIGMTKYIVYGSFGIELIGTLLLALRLVPKMGFFKGVYNSAFLAVSAFCNAGFDLNGQFGEFSSMTTMYSDTLIMLTLSALMLVGSIGFFVWGDVIKNKQRFKKYRLHSKIAITMTILLSVLGTLAYLLFESSGVLSGMTFFDKIISSFFTSISARTAGFNCVDTATLSPASKFLTVIFMFIGGSPGSTAGGVKTVTIAVVLISFLANIKNNGSQNVFKRRLESHALVNAVSVISINLFLVFAGVFLISAVQPELPLSAVVFECFAAMENVGMSMAVTDELHLFSRFIVSFLMFCGRIGSLSFVLIFTQQRGKNVVVFPQEKVSIG